MDLLLIVLVAIAMLLLALRGRQKRNGPGARRRPQRPTPPPPRGRRWSFSRHPREDWRYWRDLAILIGLVLMLLLATVVIGTRNG